MRRAMKRSPYLSREALILGAKSSLYLKDHFLPDLLQYKKCFCLFCDSYIYIGDEMQCAFGISVTFMEVEPCFSRQT